MIFDIFKQIISERLTSKKEKKPDVFNSLEMGGCYNILNENFTSEVSETKKKRKIELAQYKYKICI